MTDPIRKDSLCSTCKFSLCLDHGSDRHPERLVFCHFISTGNGRAIPQPVRECDHYSNKHAQTLQEMEATAWTIETTEKPVAEIGFHESDREYKIVIRPPKSQNEDDEYVDATGNFLPDQDFDEDSDDDD